MPVPSLSRETPPTRLTPFRQRVLNVLLDTPYALTHLEIEGRLGNEGMDRVTLYRTLEWLVSRGLAHKVSGEDRAWRFNSATREGHGHAHFHCTSCGRVYCLEAMQPVFALALPRGFQHERIDLTLHGRCPECHAGQ